MGFAVKYIVVFLTGLVAALLLVPLVKKIAPALGLVDQPSERRIHKTPIPRCGGIAVFAATHLALALVFFGPWRHLSGSIQKTLRVPPRPKPRWQNRRLPTPVPNHLVGLPACFGLHGIRGKCKWRQKQIDPAIEFS